MTENGVDIFLVLPIKKYLRKHISNAFTELGHNCIYLPIRSSPITIIAVSYCSYCNCFHDAGNRILQKHFVLDRTLVLKHKTNSDGADDMKNGLKGIRLKHVKNKEFPKGKYVGINLWSHVFYSTCFKPTQFQSKICPRFGTNLYITEIYKRTILISHCNHLFFLRGACMYSLLHLVLFELQSVSWILAEFYFNRGLQRLYTGTCIILQKTINGFLCLLIVFLKSKTYQLILKDVIKLNRNLR